MINELVNFFGWGMDKIMATQKIDLYHYKLL